VTRGSGARTRRGPVPSRKWRTRANRRTCAEAEVRIAGDGVVMDSTSLQSRRRSIPETPFTGESTWGDGVESTPVAVSMDERSKDLKSWNAPHEMEQLLVPSPGDPPTGSRKLSHGASFTATLDGRRRPWKNCLNPMAPLPSSELPSPIGRWALCGVRLPDVDVEHRGPDGSCHGQAELALSPFFPKASALQASAQVRLPCLPVHTPTWPRSWPPSSLKKTLTIPNPALKVSPFLPRESRTMFHSQPPVSSYRWVCRFHRGWRPPCLWNATPSGRVDQERAREC
jgi:hypothetical protein